MLAINIITPTSGGDKYKQVAINTFPIITSETLEEVLASEDFIDFLKKKIDPRLIDSAELYVIDSENEGKTDIINIKHQIFDKYI